MSAPGLTFDTGGPSVRHRGSGTKTGDGDGDGGVVRYVPYTPWWLITSIIAIVGAIVVLAAMFSAMDVCKV